MALHMMTERIKPEEPSSAPATISSLLFEHESHRRGRKSGVGVQQRDHRRHVRAADGDDQQHAEQQRDADDEREQSASCPDGAPG